MKQASIRCVAVMFLRSSGLSHIATIKPSKKSFVDVLVGV